jgi:hypothetical protein
MALGLARCLNFPSPDNTDRKDATTMRTPYLGKRNRKGLDEDGSQREAAFAKTLRELRWLSEQKRRTSFTRSIIPGERK